MSTLPPNKFCYLFDKYHNLRFEKKKKRTNRKNDNRLVFYNAKVEVEKLSLLDLRGFRVAETERPLGLSRANPYSLCTFVTLLVTHLDGIKLT